MQQVYTVTEAATVLRAHPNIIRKLLHNGRLGGFRIGRAWRIAESDLSAYMATQGRLSHEGREQWNNLVQAQETALQALWDNPYDEVWNDA